MSSIYMRILIAVGILSLQSVAMAATCENSYHYRGSLVIFGWSSWYAVPEANATLDACATSAKSLVGTTFTRHEDNPYLGSGDETYRITAGKFRYTTDDGFEVIGKVQTK